MSDIINLNKARKAKSKQQKAAKAAENRVVFGLSTYERKRVELINKRDEAQRAAHRLKPVTATKTIDGEQ